MRLPERRRRAIDLSSFRFPCASSYLPKLAKYLLIFYKKSACDDGCKCSRDRLSRFCPGKLMYISDTNYVLPMYTTCASVFNSSVNELTDENCAQGTGGHSR